MSREWKPGDVAMVTAANRGVPYRSFFDGEVWRDCERGSFCVVAPTSIRPLVVIDPEDMADVERVRDACWRGGTTERWQDHLRSLVAPPQPDEPTGLGAVVADEDNECWVAFASKTGRWWRNYQGDHRRYVDVDAVRVLSEGFQGPDEPLADWERDLLRGAR